MVQGIPNTYEATSGPTGRSNSLDANVNADKPEEQPMVHAWLQLSGILFLAILALSASYIAFVVAGVFKGHWPTASPGTSQMGVPMLPLPLMRSTVQVGASFATHSQLMPWTKHPYSHAGGIYGLPGAATSGVVVDRANKLILTGDFVAQDAAKIWATSSTDTQQFDAEVVLLAEDIHLALVRVNDDAFWKDFEKDLPPMTFATELPSVSTPVQISGYFAGQSAVAVQSATVSQLQFGQTTTTFGRSQGAAGFYAKIHPQPDKTFNSGPVFSLENAQGPALGFMALVVGNSYFVPGLMVQRFLDEYRSGGKWGGLVTLPALLRDMEAKPMRDYWRLDAGKKDKNKKMEGVHIRSVAPLSDLAKQNVQKGDVLVSIDGVPVNPDGTIPFAIGGNNFMFPLGAALARKKDGDTVELGLLRLSQAKSATGAAADPKHMKVNVKLTPPQPLIESLNGKGTRPGRSKPPSFFTVAGLVFTTLTQDVIREFTAAGQEAMVQMPDETLMQVMRRWREDPDEEVVIFLRGIQDRCNQHYMLEISRVLTHFNGKKIKNLKDLVTQVGATVTSFKKRVQQAMQGGKQLEIGNGCNENGDDFLEFTFLPDANKDTGGAVRGDPDMVLMTQCAQESTLPGMAKWLQMFGALPFSPDLVDTFGDTMLGGNKVVDLLGGLERAAMLLPGYFGDQYLKAMQAAQQKAMQFQKALASGAKLEDVNTTSHLLMAQRNAGGSFLQTDEEHVDRMSLSSFLQTDEGVMQTDELINLAEVQVPEKPVGLDAVKVDKSDWSAFNEASSEVPRVTFSASLLETADVSGGTQAKTPQSGLQNHRGYAWSPFWQAPSSDDNGAQTASEILFPKHTDPAEKSDQNLRGHGPLMGSFAETESTAVRRVTNEPLPDSQVAKGDIKPEGSKDDVKAEVTEEKLPTPSSIIKNPNTASQTATFSHESGQTEALTNAEEGADGKKITPPMVKLDGKAVAAPITKHAHEQMKTRNGRHDKAVRGQRNIIKSSSGSEETNRLPMNNVVRIDSVNSKKDYSMPWKPSGQFGARCSGIILDVKSRFILTCAHCVGNSEMLFVSREDFPEKTIARVVEVAHDLDLAWMTADNSNGFWDNVEIQSYPVEQEAPGYGSEVQVVGYPIGGTAITQTKGVVARVDAMVYPNGMIQSFRNSPSNLLVFQVDAAINPGNSGGPAFNGKGELLGIAFAGLARAQNVGYVIPNTVVMNFIQATVRAGQQWVAQTDFGVRLRPMLNPSLRAYWGLGQNDHGVQVRTIAPLSGLEKAGLRKTDVLVKVDGDTITDNGQVSLQGGADKFLVDLDVKITGKQRTIPEGESELKNGQAVGQNELVGKKAGAKEKGVSPMPLVTGNAGNAGNQTQNEGGVVASSGHSGGSGKPSWSHPDVIQYAPTNLMILRRECKAGKPKLSQVPMSINLTPVPPLVPRFDDTAVGLMQEDIGTRKAQELGYAATPSYYVVGGLVWAVLSQPLLNSLVEEKANVPHSTLLCMYRWKRPSDAADPAIGGCGTETKEVVVMLRGLDHKVNEYYGKSLVRVLKYFNGEPVQSLKGLIGQVGNAFKSKARFLSFSFEALEDGQDLAASGDDPDIVLDAREVLKAEASGDILSAYGLQSAVSMDLAQAYKEAMTASPATNA